MAFDRFSWAIGIFEGEGSVGAYRCGSRAGRIQIQPKFSVWSTDIDVVRRVRAAFGCGRIYGPITRQRKRFPNAKAIWVWEVQRRGDFERLVASVLPHLGVRRRLQARKALKTLKERPRRLTVNRPADCGYRAASPYIGYRRHYDAGEIACARCTNRHNRVCRRNYRARAAA